MMWLAFFLEKGAESEGSQFRIFGLFEGNQQFKRDVLGGGGAGNLKHFHILSGTSHSALLAQTGPESPARNTAIGKAGTGLPSLGLQSLWMV